MNVAMTAAVWTAVWAPLSLMCSSPSQAPIDATTVPAPARGESITIVGNTLAERMQHFGWLEARLQRRFPDRQLRIRNLGYSADELTIRLRSADFGSPDENLARVNATTVFAFFGFNESFEGAQGLAKFRKDLDAFIANSASQKYDKKSPPKFVLFSPIAYQQLQDKNLPPAEPLNARIALYTQAMREVAQSHQTPFVDLFKPTRKLFSETTEALTINGVHLNEQGDRLLSAIIERSLYGSADAADPPAALREAVLDKNFHWFNRHRTVDGYSIYGGRADLKFVADQTNREVMKREMEILDVMTANRDRRIHALAAGKNEAVDDSNTPPFIKVVTNKPGTGPNGEHLYLGGQDAIGKMTVAAGMKVNLFASEEMFPELALPVQMAFDPAGRLWVAVMPSYPHWKPKEKLSDKLLVLEDTDQNGVADRCTVFADGLHVPTGLEFWNGGVYVGQQPDLMFLTDADNDGKADVRTRILHGVDSADTHHALNSFTIGPEGALYFQEGTFHHTQVETPYGPQRCVNAGVYRFEPKSHRFEVYVSYPFANPHGHVFDRWGQDFITDGTSNQNYFAAGFSTKLDYPNKHPSMKTYFNQRVRPCAATEILSSRHFPDEMQGDLLNANVIGFQGILRYRFKDEGSGFSAEEAEPIVYSSDANFRPTDIEVGPDGAIYFTDWQNPVIGHMQHNLRDPSRGKTHGRVYRVTYPSRPLATPPKIAGASVEALLELLKDSQDRVRFRARCELSGRDSTEIQRAAERWVAGLDVKDPDVTHHTLEALWLFSQHNIVNTELLNRMLAVEDYRARAAATRVLCYWRDRIPNALDLLRRLAADPHPRVRLEAVRAASFFDVPEAVEIAAVASDYPMDYYLSYVRGESLRRLEPIFKSAIAAGRNVPFSTDAGARYLLEAADLATLLKMDRNSSTCMELLTRPGVGDADRAAAAVSLAGFDHSNVSSAYLKGVERFSKAGDRLDGSAAFDLVRLLARQPKSERASIRPTLEKLALGSGSPAIRRLGFVALVGADGDAGPAMQLAQQTPQGLIDFSASASSFGDPGVRAALYPRLTEWTRGFPASMEVPKSSAAGAVGRIVRIELPGQQRTLTLAEVEVYSNGQNVARAGKAKQKNTSHGGSAEKAIDGNTSGIFGTGGQTHSVERTSDPWWEVDLGQELPIEKIVVYNRTEDKHGLRLDGFTLQVLTADRKTVFNADENSAPATQVAFDLHDAGLESILRRSAMNALTSVRGKEAETFSLLSTMIQQGVDRQGAALALQKLPSTSWPADQVGPLADSLVAYVGGLPVAERNSPAASDLLQLGFAVADRLPIERGRELRRRLGDVGVRVIRLATVPDQMIYDRDRLVLQAGKPVEVLFENPDLMPHNWVLTTPGSLVEVGELAEKTGLEPNAVERQYVPASDKVLAASRLLQPQQKQRLRMTAPSRPGVYPYVCTYPGHWRRMYGAMFVVANLDEYLANPEGYLASQNISAVDDLLKLNRPRKEWTLTELASQAGELKDKSFANGKQMFAVANCIACHQLGGVGGQFGPDLAKLDPKYSNKDILQAILEPSHKIEDKYASFLFSLESGKNLTGMILSESPDVINVVENPLASAKPTVLPRGDVLGRKKSNVSMMPKGMLDKLTKEEILDLLAYIKAGGDAKRGSFSEAGHSHKK